MIDPDADTPLPGNRGALGWVPEDGAPLEDRGLVLAATAPSALTLPDEGALGREPWILTQRGGSCTGHMAAALIYAETGARTSPYYPWVFGRLRDGATPETLRDEGVRVSGFVRAYREHGSCAWERWRPGVAGFGLHAVPPPLLRVEAQKWNLTVREIRRTLGLPITLQVVSHLAEGRACGLHVDVDEGFDNAGRDAVGPVSGRTRGGHVVTPWRFRKAASGDYEVGCVNSWGARYGDGGIVWLSAARVEQTKFACYAEEVS